jgi:hypothetical protein
MQLIVLPYWIQLQMFSAMCISEKRMFLGWKFAQSENAAILQFCICPPQGGRALLLTVSSSVPGSSDQKRGEEDGIFMK